MFISPDTVPQDLLFIQELLGPTYTHTDEDSSSSECSEEQVEAGLVENLLSESDFDDSSSESETDIEKPSLDICEDEDEPSPPLKHDTYFRTKNELPESDVLVPDIQQVAPDEVLEQIGEILNVVENTVIVKGLPTSKNTNQTLDAETLLVFEDRQVLGYVYDTFGPTTEPLYQVRFKDADSIDKEKAQVSRKVFHVPSRSRFVFVNMTKGSDASNSHDEEPAEHELDFSDDEAEQEYKRRKRAASRQNTPVPSATVYPGTAFDEYSLYDMDFTSGPSSQALLPYNDDPQDEPMPHAPVLEAGRPSTSTALDRAKALRPVRRPRRNPAGPSSESKDLAYDPSSPGIMPPPWSQPSEQTMVLPHINPNFASAYLGYVSQYQQLPASERRTWLQEEGPG